MPQASSWLRLQWPTHLVLWGRREERIEKSTGFANVQVCNAELRGLETELRALVAAGRADGFLLYLLGLVLSERCVGPLLLLDPCCHVGLAQLLIISPGPFRGTRYGMACA